ncbi:MAG: ABC transporter substrate-binding protein [Desulfamplus sp.]|nr:ABC transporter substrate-binding protein [Desulfamplus sp.]
MHKQLPYIVCVAISMLLLSLIFSGCDKPDITSECVDNIGCIDLKQGEPLKIGVLQSLSGNVAPLGLEQIRGLELAMDKWGSHILDHTIHLQIEDTECTAEGGANAALKVIDR